MSLPLPEKKTILVAIEGSPAYFSGYSTEQMQAYGQDCRAAALEEAAQICNGEQWRNSARPVAYIEAFNQGCGDCEAAIRRLK